MGYMTLNVATEGEKFYHITPQVNSELAQFFAKNPKAKPSGMLFVFVTHTSCALTINEGFDPNATKDIENFLKHVAKRDLPFIEHDDEGEDDSPSHMKTSLLQPSLSLIVENKNVVLGKWQGIFLAEFRDAPKTRTILLKYMQDT